MDKPWQKLRFSSFDVRGGPAEAGPARGYVWGYFHFRQGYFPQGGWMALTDVEIKRAKAKDKAYRMSDSGGMYLWVTPAGGKLFALGVCPRA